MSDWRTIDSAPKDGTFILLAHRDGVSSGYFDFDWMLGEAAGYDGNHPIWLTHVTHWMPLPNPPETTS